MEKERTDALEMAEKETAQTKKKEEAETEAVKLIAGVPERKTGWL